VFDWWLILHGIKSCYVLTISTRRGVIGNGLILHHVLIEKRVVCMETVIDQKPQIAFMWGQVPVLSFRIMTCKVMIVCLISMVSSKRVLRMRRYKHGTVSQSRFVAVLNLFCRNCACVKQTRHGPVRAEIVLYWVCIRRLCVWLQNCYAV